MAEFSLRLAFMLVATPVACALGLWRPFWGLLCLIFLYYFRPDVWGMEAMPWFRPILWITIAVAVGWATRVRTFRFHGLLGLSLLVLLAHLVSSFTAVMDRDLALSCTTVLSKLMVVQFLALQLIDTPRKMTQFLWANILGMAWNMKTILVLGITGEGIKDDVRVDVAVGQGGGANYLAMLLVMFLPFLFLKFQNGTRKERQVSMAFGLAILLCVILTGSRGGFVALGITLFYILLQSNRKILGGLAVVFAAIVFFVVVPQTHVDRFMSGVGDAEGKRDFAAQSRIHLWNAAIRMFKEAPVLGVGPDNFQMLSPRYVGFYSGSSQTEYKPGVDEGGFVAHSTWFQTLAEGGLLSAIPFFLIFPIVFLTLRRARKLIPLSAPGGREYYTHSVGLEGLFVAFVIGSTFGSHIKLDFLWWYLGAASALYLNAEARVTAALEVRQREARLSRRGLPGGPLGIARG